MKKYFTIMMCAGLLLTVTGCGNEAKEKVSNKVLSCERSSSESDISTDTTVFLYDLEGKSFSEATLERTIPYEGTISEDKRKELTVGFCKNYNEDELSKKCDTKIDGNNFLVIVDMDVDKLDINKNGFNKNTPIDELKEIMENLGVTCKIEEK